MEFEWGEEKATKNYLKHSVRFSQITPAFFDPLRIEAPDFTHTEERYHLIGQIQGRIVFIVYTWREDRIRIISARKATNYEQKIYHTGHENE